MSGKTGVLVGLMIGLVIAAGAAFATMLVLGGAVKEREVRAYEQGYADRMQHALEEPQRISASLNQGLVEENERLATNAENALARLKELASQPDLSAESRNLAEAAIKDLGP